MRPRRRLTDAKSVITTGRIMGSFGEKLPLASHPFFPISYLPHHISTTSRTHRTAIHGHNKAPRLHPYEAALAARLATDAAWRENPRF